MGITLPEKFANRMRWQLGGEYEAYLECLNESVRSGLRVNTLKLLPEEFEMISPYPLERIPWVKNGYFYPEKEQPAKHPFYFAGLYYLQEPSAMLPAALLPVAPGERVLDLCAAPGGKSTELAAKLKGEGVLLSNDISNSRAKALLKNMELFGVKNAVITSEAPEKLARRFAGYFDKILVDAPCSGEGMFRKSPAIMKNWEQYGTAYYNALQRQILPEAVKMLKPGGMLLYSTCTFSPEEDEGMVQFLLDTYPELEVVPILKTYANAKGILETYANAKGILETCADAKGILEAYPNVKGIAELTQAAAMAAFAGNVEGNATAAFAGATMGNAAAAFADTAALDFSGFECGRPDWIPNGSDALRGTVRLWPHKIRGEGHFIALLRKAERAKFVEEEFPRAKFVEETSPRAKFTKEKSSKEKIPAEVEEFLRRLSFPWDRERLLLRDGRVFLVPEGLPDLSGLRILRTGLLLGEGRKGHFEPSQALANALKKTEYGNCYSLLPEDISLEKYLKCETIEPACPLADGFALVCAGDYPLGWGKVGKGGFKNKYLPGWRMM